MKLLLPFTLIGASIAFAAGTLDIWSNLDNDKIEYVDSNWLGGELSIKANSDLENPENLQLRIKMTGAGSIPRGTSKYFVTGVSQGSELPVTTKLRRSNSDWRVLPGPAGDLEIEVGDRNSVEGVIQTYSFKAEASE